MSRTLLPWDMATIGQLAQRTRESVKTLRYWTDSGLLEADRGANGYRYYGDEAITRVEFIRSAQALGLTLREIGDVLQARNQDGPPCPAVRAVLARHLHAVRDRLAQLRRLEEELAARVKWAEEHPKPACESEGCVYLAEPAASHHHRAA